MTSTKADLTFKHNIQQGRHGWLRLTPAYSVKVVHSILAEVGETAYVLDPFSGTGTTGLVCGERGLRCDLLDINPFLVWFAEAKTASYSADDLNEARNGASSIVATVVNDHPENNIWVPPISNISRWWSDHRLRALSQVYHELNDQFPVRSRAKDILLVAFCRLVIEWSNASFNHQSMSFKGDTGGLFSFAEQDMIYSRFSALAQEVISAAALPVKGSVRVFRGDARQVPQPTEGLYSCVITSPPYPNRMSYIRELRPYMYWLGYLDQAREAGELDWQAIGGTWGIATSRLLAWQPNGTIVAYPEFDQLIAQIAGNSQLLANYVHKYFVDVVIHLRNLLPTLVSGARVFYIVGNSKFYGTLVPVEEIYAHLLTQTGFEDVKVEILRKRNSKKELFEYVVSARKPALTSIG